MSLPYDAECMEDALTDAISDSFDIDWTPSWGARAAMKQLGLWELYEIADQLDRSGYGLSREHRTALREACAKVRGDEVPTASRPSEQPVTTTEMLEALVGLREIIPLAVKRSVGEALPRAIRKADEIIAKAQVSA